MNKELEALEIIKRKGINTRLLKDTDTFKEYNLLTVYHYGMQPLTLEEYHLLKKVLK